MRNNLIPEREESGFVGIFVFMNMNRGDFQRVIAVCPDILVDDTFEILLDVNHQHMLMLQLFFLHTITFSGKIVFFEQRI